MQTKKVHKNSDGRPMCGARYALQTSGRTPPPVSDDWRQVTCRTCQSWNYEKQTTAEKERATVREDERTEREGEA